MLHITLLIRSLVKGVAAHVSATQRAWLQIPKGSRPLQFSLLSRVGSSPDPVSTDTQKKKTFTVFIHIFFYFLYLQFLN